MSNKQDSNYADPDVLAKYIEEIHLLLENGQTQEAIIDYLVAKKQLSKDIALLLFNQATFGDMDASVEISAQEGRQMHYISKTAITHEELCQLFANAGLDFAPAQQLATEFLTLLESQPNLSSQQLIDLMMNSGLTLPAARELERTISAKHQLIQQKQERTEVLNTIDPAIKEKIIFWRNNAFPNNEIVQKLVAQYNVSEEEAKRMVKVIHVDASTQEREIIKEEEAGREVSIQVAIGLLLLIGGIMATIFSGGQVLFYGAIISGIVTTIAGLVKRQ